ncbi:MAG: PHP domain-containing protein, partial [Bacteroidota bacterium]
MHSYYSLRYGTMSPEAVSDKAKALGWDVLPLTDINTTMGVPEFYRICKDKGIQPLAGVDLREGDTQLAVLMARNQRGLLSINRLLTAKNWEEQDYRSGLKLLEEAEIIYPFESA